MEYQNLAPYFLNAALAGLPNADGFIQPTPAADSSYIAEADEVPATADPLPHSRFQLIDSESTTTALTTRMACAGTVAGGLLDLMVPTVQASDGVEPVSASPSLNIKWAIGGVTVALLLAGAGYAWSRVRRPAVELAVC